jgi:23S rRNA (adenine2503-C2)-methyltransferase
MLPEELEEWLTSLGYPKYRARQVFGWINKQGAGSVRQMTNLPATLRELLQKDFRTGTVEAEQCSKDGSRKLLIRFDDGQRVETVLLPQGTRFTICLSSQAGCGMGCAFCATGREGLSRLGLPS